MSPESDTPERLVLHAEPHFISPYVFACFVTLEEKGLAYELSALDSEIGETRADDYLAQTVTGRVPSLVHGDYGLAESSAIVEYLEDRFAERPVMPVDVRERARCRQLMSWLRSDDTESIREERPSTTIFYAPPGTALSASARGAMEKLDRVVARLVGDGAHIFQDWCIADAELAFMLMRLVKGGDEVSATSRAYAERQWQRPSVQAYASLPRPPLQA